MANLGVALPGLEMANPLMLASGIQGGNAAALHRVAATACGGLVSKSIGPEPREMYPGPVCVEAADSVVLNAMGHAFFTLAVGACALMAYGAYMPDEQSLPRAVFGVAVLDIMVALLSGIAIFSIVFTHGLDPAEGPGLMFVTLPIAFSELPGGQVIKAQTANTRRIARRDITWEDPVWISWSATAGVLLAQ